MKPNVRLTGERAIKRLPLRHVFVDLETVKKDADYELFFLRKEDGTRFYSPRLIRNIKLVCNFGDYFGAQRKVEDPLEDLPRWLERGFQASAAKMLKSLAPRLERFYKDVYRFKEQELVETLNKALMALMLAARLPKGHNSKRRSVIFTIFKVTCVKRSSRINTINHHLPP